MWSHTMRVPASHHYSATVGRALGLRGISPSEFASATASPERLLLSSLAMCLLTTFEVFAARDGIEVHDWNVYLSGTVERSPGTTMFTSIILSLDLAITGNIDNVDTTIEHAKQYCLVLNSLRLPVVIETTIRAPQFDERAAS